ncbi:hypothetical protein GW17_00032661 [Ensete ventricosum]|nr:hypothetical protein GW17_00032661 [Ensete ventricosum]
MSGGACGKCRLVSSVLKRSQGELLGELRDRVISVPWGWGMSLPSEGDRGFFPGIVRQRTLLRYQTLLLASKCYWILCRGWGVSTAWLDPHAQDHLSRIGGLAWLGWVRNGVDRCSLGLGDPPLECSAPWSVPARRSRERQSCTVHKGEYEPRWYESCGREDAVPLILSVRTLLSIASRFDHCPMFFRANSSSVGETRTRRRRRKANGDGAGGEAKKTRLSDEQLKFLEMSFQDERKLESGRKVHLATELGLDPKQVAVWFQNRRARHKNKQVEEAYAKLKMAHDAVVFEKCHLENEVSKLKEKLLEAEEEIRKLSLGTGGAGASGSNAERGGSSPSSSLSTVSHHPLVGEFGVEGEADLMNIQEYNFNSYMMEWANFYGV